MRPVPVLVADEDSRLLVSISPHRPFFATHSPLAPSQLPISIPFAVAPIQALFALVLSCGTMTRGHHLDGRRKPQNPILNCSTRLRQTQAGSQLGQNMVIAGW